MTEIDSVRELALRRLDDSHARLRYQHEYAVEGFKTLVLINGGAIIGLLTFAGHASTNAVARQLSSAFLGYTIGLIVAVLAYLAAYQSQASLMNMDVVLAYRMLGVEPSDSGRAEKYEWIGTAGVYAGIGLSIVSLVAFVIGSWSAISAISK